MEIGLTSVTFRDLDSKKIIEYCEKLGLTCIEWGSDVHIPCNDAEKAKSIYAETIKSKISVSSYGTYYRIGESENPKSEFAKYVEIAKIIHAPVIRVWAGTVGSGACTSSYFEKIVGETKLICDEAEKYNIDVAFEYHDDTLADNLDGVKKLIRCVNKNNLGVYFQYSKNESIAENVYTLNALIGYVKIIHVFYVGSNYERFLISEGDGIKLWHEIVKVLKEKKSDARLLIEFLKDSSFDGLKKETDTLKNIILTC